MVERGEGVDPGSVRMVHPTVGQVQASRREMEAAIVALSGGPDCEKLLGPVSIGKGIVDSYPWCL